MLPSAALEHERQQQALHDLAERSVRRAWAPMRSGATWQAAWTGGVAASVTKVLTSAQEASAATSETYMAAVLAELGLGDTEAPALNLDGFLGVAGDGRNLTAGAYGAVIQTVDAFYAPDAPSKPAEAAQQALDSGADWLSEYLATVLADVDRAVQSVITASQPSVSGYIRMVEPGACSRCVVLAGKFYRYNDGFLRHPRCRCRHIPATEDLAGDFRTNPSTYFDSLTKTEQDKVFTNAGAEAIRLGADPIEVVNARRGMTTAQQNPAGWIPKGRQIPTDVNGRPTYITTEGTTKRGTFGRINKQRRADGKPALPVRLMPESIIALATDRADAIRLLRTYGYLR